MRQPAGGGLGPPPTLEIVVPAHNEERRLPGGLATLRAHLARMSVDARVIVVDNASTDGTAEVVARCPSGPVPVRLLRCPVKGKGAAVRAGLLDTSAPMVGFCDTDMATGLDVLGYVVYLLGRGEQVVVGSRNLPASVLEVRHGLVRSFGSQVFRRLARIMVPGATDTQCGFKFFDGDLARRVARDLTSTGFAFDVELLARCLALGASIREIPVIWRDVPGSTFSVGRSSAGVARELYRTWLTLRAMPVAEPDRMGADGPERVGADGPERVGAGGP
ncbi:glycosyltransferase, partial [Micromonospora zhanjiangensis]